jgi:hypothetical protein
MNDLVGLVMEAAAIELLHVDALQIDREVQRLVAEMEHAPVEELRRDDFAQRFLELLKRRGEVARKALIIFEEPQSEEPRAPESIKWTISTFGVLGKHQRAGSR